MGCCQIFILDVTVSLARSFSRAHWFLEIASLVIYKCIVIFILPGRYQYKLITCINRRKISKVQFSSF